ncbi:MAG TPA: MaoC family dehydratase [bacterium]|nr:MaoC family dehydratase [bacterium]
MAKVMIPTVGALKDWVGKEVGVSEWKRVTQEEVDLFAKATGDMQWIHTDPERAATESPYKRTIAHGYFTLSLAPMLRAQIVDVEKKRMTINYGLNKLRFPAPLPVGEEVRMRALLTGVEDIKGGVQSTWTLTFEVSGQDKPACVAEAIYRYLE